MKQGDNVPDGNQQQSQRGQKMKKNESHVEKKH
jgi:hypothetical protein